MDINVALLREWLGPEGALAGLDKSKLTNSELMMLARENGIIVDKKTARRQIVVEIVMSPLKRINVETAKLLEMSRDELRRYFSDHLVSSREIMELLSLLGIAPRGKIQRLSDFAANEISDLGMYQRVAKGRTAEAK